jgi:hypothetical protein
MEEEVRKYGEELRGVQNAGVSMGTGSDLHNDSIEILGPDNRNDIAVGESFDKRIKLEITLAEVAGIVQHGHTIDMIWEQLKEFEDGFVIYYNNAMDNPGNVKRDGFCGYRSLDAVRRGLRNHNHPLEVDVLTYIRSQTRTGSDVNQKCAVAAGELRQGCTSLDEVFWFSRRDFRDVLCPVPLMLWMVAYEERFNVLVGAGQQGRYMVTGDGRMKINRRMVADHIGEGGRDIVYNSFHFFLGHSEITMTKMDEALYQIAMKIWNRRLHMVTGGEELSQELYWTRAELYHIYYPP